MTVKLLTGQTLEFLSLTGGFTGVSKSTLVKMPHCWKSLVAAHLSFVPGSYCFKEQYDHRGIVHTVASMIKAVWNGQTKIFK